MRGHHADAFRPLLDNRRVGRARTVRLTHLLLDEEPERRRALRLERLRQLDELRHVGEGLLAVRPVREARVGAGCLEQRLDRVGDRPSVPLHVERAEERQRLGDLVAREGRAQRMERPVPFAEEQEGLVRVAEERPLERAVDVELVVGPLDRHERRAQRRDLFAQVEGASADEHVRDAARLHRLHVRAEHVAPLCPELAEQETDVARRDRNLPTALLDRPPARREDPVHPRADDVRVLLIDSLVLGATPVAVRVGREERHDGRHVEALDAVVRQRDVAGLAPVGGALHLGREGRVHEVLDPGPRAKARHEIEERSAVRHQVRLDLFVEPDVRAAEPVDRLLRIADDEHLARDRARRTPVGRVGIVERQQKEDFDLERIGVLELVDEDAAEACLELAAHGRRADEEPTRADQQIDEIERPRLVLEALVERDDALQLGVQERREIVLRVARELVERASSRCRASGGSSRDPSSDCG